MTDDASLTDFAGREDGADDAGNGGSNDPHDGRTSDPENGAPGPDDGPESDDADPETPTFTYTSTPDGAECAACGEMVEKRWHAGEGGTAEKPDLDPDALVCPDCKEW